MTTTGRATQRAGREGVWHRWGRVERGAAFMSEGGVRVMLGLPVAPPWTTAAALPAALWTAHHSTYG